MSLKMKLQDIKYKKPNQYHITRKLGNLKDFSRATIEVPNARREHMERKLEVTLHPLPCPSVTVLPSARFWGLTSKTWMTSAASPPSSRLYPFSLQADSVWNDQLFYHSELVKTSWSYFHKSSKLLRDVLWRQREDKVLPFLHHKRWSKLFTLAPLHPPRAQDSFCKLVLWCKRLATNSSYHSS